MKTSFVLAFCGGLVACASSPSAPHGSETAARQGPEALVHVQRIAADDPLLWIDFAAIAPEVDDALAARVLSGVVTEVADLSLARTRVGDATLALCARMPELRRLDLRGTKVTALGLAELSRCKKLASLSLAETRLGEGAGDALARLEGVRRLELWRSDVAPEAIASLAVARKDLRIESGTALETAVLEEEPPPKVTKSARTPPAAAPSNALCPVSNKPVVTGHTIVDEGKTIGFCCEMCLAKFRADPAKFRPALR